MENLFEIRITPDASDLALIERELNMLPKISEAALEQVADDLKTGWKFFITEVDALDSHDFVQSVDKHKVSAAEFVVDTDNNADVIYSDIVERGRRATETHAGYPGRFPAEKALEAFDAADMAERRYTEALFRFLHQ